MAAVAMTALDEGLNGVHLDIVNDTAAPIAGHLRVDLYRDGALLMESADTHVSIDARGSVVVSADGLFDGFRDLTWAYRFGAANYDVIAATLTDADGADLAHAFHLPLGRARDVESALTLSARAELSATGQWCLTLLGDRFAQSVAIDVNGFRPDDNWFHLAPGAARKVNLESTTPGAATPIGTVSSLNMSCSTAIEVIV